MQSNKTIAISIVIAGIIIAGAILLAGSGDKAPATPEDTGKNTSQETVNISPVTPDDHILGNPDAPIVLIEYSDIECPFCKNFHNTLHRIIDEYGPSGEVAWVYRHFPIVSLHKQAYKEAVATECAAEQKGNDGFWQYIDEVFERTTSNDGLNPAELSVIAGDIGLDVKAFNTCLESGRYDEKIDAHIAEAIAAGAQGTPHTIVVSEAGQGTIPGAQPYANVKQFLDGLIADMEGTQATDTQ